MKKALERRRRDRKHLKEAEAMVEAGMAGGPVDEDGNYDDEDDDEDEDGEPEVGDWLELDITCRVATTAVILPTCIYQEQHIRIIDA